MLNEKAQAYFASKRRSFMYWWTLLRNSFFAWGKLLYKSHKKQKSIFRYLWKVSKLSLHEDNNRGKHLYHKQLKSKNKEALAKKDSTSDVLKVRWKTPTGILWSQCLARRRIAFAAASLKWALSTALQDGQTHIWNPKSLKHEILWKQTNQSKTKLVIKVYHKNKKYLWLILPWFYIFRNLSKQKNVFKDFQKVINPKPKMCIFDRQVAFDHCFDSKYL